MAGWSTTLETIRRAVGPAARVVFDVGANDGSLSELYQVMFDQAVIHAFEPQPEVFATLARKFGRTPRMVPNRVALGDHVGSATLHCNNDTRTSSLLALDPASSWAQELNLATVAQIEVPLDTIDHYCGERGIGAIDFLKIDTQGFEPDCLRGAAGMLQRQAIRAIQVEIINHKKYARRTSFLDIESLLAPCGYRLYCVVDAIGNREGELLVLDAFYVLERDHP